MRTKKSIYNMMFSMISNVIIIITGLISQKFFLSYLGAEYLGLNGLFTNIISLLGIAEMGIGTSIIYHLYKPVSNDKIEEIKSLMFFYKISYRLIAIFVSVIGIGLIPFLSYIIGDLNIEINIYLIYIICLLDIVISYLLSYKRSIINANQENYIIQIIHIFYTIGMNTVQIISLYLTANYYLYLTEKVVFRLLENMIISYMANKKYPYINDKNVLPLSKEIKRDIFVKVKALLYHKMGAFFINGSDNILISKLLNVVTVGYYSNYKLVISAVQTVLCQAIGSLTSSIGNLLVETKSKRIIVYNRLEFLLFWLATFSTSCILTCMEDFIFIWIGKFYILDTSVLVMLSINFYLMTMRSVNNMFKDAAGIFHEDRFIPFVELFANIIFSIIFSKIFGLAGIFLGTILSNLVLHLYSYPKYMFKNVFDEGTKYYYLMIFKYYIVSIIICILTFTCSRLINFENIYLCLIKDILVALFIPNMILYSVYKGNKNFLFFKGFIKKLIKSQQEKLLLRFYRLR